MASLGQTQNLGTAAELHSSSRREVLEIEPAGGDILTQRAASDRVTEPFHSESSSAIRCTVEDLAPSDP